METILSTGGRFVLAVVALMGLVGFAEGLRARGWAAALTRRIVHVGVGFFVVVTPWLFEGPLPVYGLAFLFVGVNATTRAWGWWTGTHGGRPDSWGTVTFPLALLPALAATWSVDPGRTFILQIAFLVLALADPVASWIGTSLDRPGPYRVGADLKSVAGSVGFFVVALGGTVLALILPGPAAVPEWSLLEIFGAGVAVASATTAVEALASRGWDNFFIVVASLAVLLILTQYGVGWGVGGLGAGTAFAVLAYRGGALSAGGAVAGGLFAASLVGGGGWAWVVPGLVFFVLSSALSFLSVRRGASEEGDAETPPARTASQVYANGGVAWALLLAHLAVPHSLWYVGSVGAFAAAAADTWATELGSFSITKPISLRTLRPVSRGTSGAVSLLGTGGAILGAASVAGAAVLVDGPLTGSPGSDLALLVCGGGVGMLFDSVLGATLQARYLDPVTGGLTESPCQEAVLVRGWARIDNESVNFLGTAAGAVVGMAGVVLGLV